MEGNQTNLHSKSINKILNECKKEAERKKRELGLYLSPNMPLSYNGYSDFVFTAVRGIGKTVIGLETAIILKRKYGYENVKCFYFRLNDNSIKALYLADL